jgi:PAS domain S-box-containing protein
MSDRNNMPSKRLPADGSVTNTARPVRLFAALSMCVAAAAITIAVFFVALPAERRIQTTDTWVEHTQQVIVAIGDLLANADDAETGQRGFLLTEDARFLEPYDSGIETLWRHFSTIQELTVDNPGQQGRLQVLRGLLLNRLAVLASTIELARGGNLKAAVDLVREGDGKALMDSVRETSADMTAEEERLLRVRHLDQATARQRSNWITLALMILGGGCGVLISGTMTAAAVLAASARRQSAATAAEHLRLLNMLEFAPIMMRDIGGTVRFWSEGCRHLYGWTAEQAIGQSSFDLLQTVCSAPPDEIEAELLRTGEWSGELYQRTQTGTEVIVLAHKVLQREADGSPLGVQETVIDVTVLRRTEAALLASQSQFRSVVNAAADAIVIAHSDGRIQTVNPAVLRMFGYDREEELVGHDLAVLMPATEAVRHGAYIANHRAGAPPRVIGMPGRELLAVRRDGSEFPIDLSVSSFGIDGQLYLTGIVRDATARRLAEMALRDSEARLRQFIDDAPAAIAMFDTAMCYLAVSRRFVNDYQLGDQGTLIGRSHYDVFPEITDTWRTIHGRVLAGETLFAEAEPFPRTDGSINWLRWEMVPWLQIDGTIGGVMLFSEDETDRKLAERALNDSEARLRLVQQVGGIAYTDRTLPELTALVSSGYADIHGLPSGQTQVSAAEFIARVHPDDRERIAAVTPASLARDGKLATEFRICWPDGSVRWIGVRTEAFLGPSGLPTRIISAQQDITEIVTAREALALRHEELKRLSRHLVKARDRAEHANRAKSRFLAGMSHELRTPLNGIIGYAHLLNMEGGLNACQSTRVDAMLEAGKHLLQMITCILDLSEIEAEHVELRPVEFDVEAVALACLDLVRPAAELKRLALNIVIAPGTRRELIADPTRLRQVLFNLLGNAVKFTSHGGVELCLRTLADGSALRIEVADTGPGIPAELRGRLFQDFERLETAGSSTVEGAGLGLSLSTRLATLMGGRLGHENNPDGGSIFWLELPLNPIAGTLSTTAPTSDVRDTASASTRVLHVLVVDDVLMNCDIAGSFLRAAGHEVTCIDDGEAAVEAAAIIDFDVVLMDIRMPGMDGLEATRRIRALEGPRGQVPIVALTAQAFTEQVAECRLAGMDDHLSKPFDPDQLLAAVVRAVAVSQTHREPVSMPITMPVAPATRVTGEELSVFDSLAFKRTTDFLAPEAVASYLQSIAQSAGALLCALHEPDALNLTGGALAEAAHGLAGSAGLLGFERLAGIGRRFDRAVQSGAPETITLADALCTTIEVTLLSIHDHTATAAASPLAGAIGHYTNTHKSGIM